MSTNDKNKIRAAFLMNFTKDILSRIIVATDSYQKKDEINRKIGEINEEVNLKIQQLNLKLSRNIPYIKVKLSFSNSNSEELERDTRIIIDNYPLDEEYDTYIRDKLQITKEEISHVVDILIAPGWNLFTVSSLSCDARLVLDYSYFIKAIIDILLDISMFNSYSFLRILNVAQRKEFSCAKLDFCKNKDIRFYSVEGSGQQYFSLAFAARDEDGELDIDKYIELWNEFINSCYKGFEHVEGIVKEQLAFHTDKSELRKNLHEDILKYDKGVYLLLRTNKDRTESIHSQLFTLFGIDKRHYRKGLTKLVPISDFETIKPLLINLDVSAFKVIVNDHNSHTFTQANIKNPRK